MTSTDNTPDKQPRPCINIVKPHFQDGIRLVTHPVSLLVFQKKCAKYSYSVSCRYIEQCFIRLEYDIVGHVVVIPSVTYRLFATSPTRDTELRDLEAT